MLEEDQPDETRPDREEDEADVLALVVQQQEHDGVETDQREDRRAASGSRPARASGSRVVAHARDRRGVRPLGGATTAVRELRASGARAAAAAAAASRPRSRPGTSDTGCSPGAHTGPRAGSSSPRMWRLSRLLIVWCDPSVTLPIPDGQGHSGRGPGWLATPFPTNRPQFAAVFGVRQNPCKQAISRAVFAERATPVENSPQG